jgi:hypothetical protein
MKDWFDPELRDRKRKAAAMAAEAERRKLQKSMESEIGAVAASPTFQAARQDLLNRAYLTFPDDSMDAAACFWFRRGLEIAVNMLDERLARAEDNDA